MAINVALNKTATASNFVMPYAASKAVNGIVNTSTDRWLTNAVPAWLRVDLGTTYCINRWVVRHLPVAGWQAPDYCLSDYKLQGSNDNNAWFDLDSIVGNTTSVTDRTFAAASYRYVRVYVTKGLKTNTQLASLLEVEVYMADNVATLSNMTLSSGTLTPAFGSGVYTYTDNVPYTVSSITLTPIATDSRATITVNGTAVASGTPSAPITLNYGTNTVTVQVTAADTATKLTYTTTVTRAGSPLLANMIVNGLSTALPFTSGTFSYTTAVGYDTSSVTISVAAQDSRSTITVNGTAVPSGGTSEPINLNVGSNTVTVIVTAVGGATQTYTVAITRNGSQYLSALTLTDIPFTFAKNTYSYNVNGGYDVATTSINATKEDATANMVITANGTVVTNGQSFNLNVGSNTITVDVTATVGGGHQQYLFTVTRLHSTRLSTLAIAKVGMGSNPTWDNSFSADRLSYSVKTYTTYVKVTPTVEDATSTFVMKVNGVVTPIANNVAAPSTVTIEVSSTYGVPMSTYSVALTK